MKDLSLRSPVTLAVAIGATSPAPPTGERPIIWSTTENAFLGWNGTNWKLFSDDLDICVFAAGPVVANETLMRLPMTRAIAFPFNLPGSVAKASAATTATRDYEAKKNGTYFATIRFSAGDSVGAVSSSGLTTFAAGDVLSIVAPSSTDATLADVGITLVGRKT